MSRLTNVFNELKANNRKGLIAYLTAGCPDIKTTLMAARQIAAAGADVIEFGIPFSDPMADGPTIQKAAALALASGTTTARTLELIAKVRRQTKVALVAMTYINNVMQFGEERFVQALASAGADGLIVPDLPAEEACELAALCRRADIDFIQFVAPTTSQVRAGAISQQASGFIYCISTTGVTGVRQVDYSRLAPVIAAVKENSQAPVAVGFGIGDSQAACAAAQYADAVIVGSAVMQRLMDEGCESAAALIASMRQALDRVSTS